MRFKKTPQSKRGTYKLYDENGNLVTEYKPGENGVTEVDILNLHRLDDHEVYINSKELKLPEWYQPIYDQWRDNYIANFIEKYGREPFADEIPGRHAVVKAVKAAGFDPYEHSVLGITAMTALLGKKKFNELLGGLVEKPQGKPTLVPMSDIRPAINTAQEDFMEVK